MIKSYIEYSGLALVSFAFNIFVWITSPLWALIAATFKLNSLPGILKWVHTHDNPIWGQNVPMPSKFVDRFKVAIRWICRNPGYGFDAYVLGFKDTAVLDQVVIKQIGPEFDKGNLALFYVVMSTTSGKRFSFRMDIPLWNGRYIKTWFGWHYINQAGYRMLKFDINPFKKSN